MKSENKETENNYNIDTSVRGPKLPKNAKRPNRKQSKQYESLFPDPSHPFSKLTFRKSTALTERKLSISQKKIRSKVSLNKNSSKLISKEKTPKPEKNQGTANISHLQKELEGLREENRILKESAFNRNAENQMFSRSVLHDSNEEWTKIQFSLIEFRKVFEKFINNK